MLRSELPDELAALLEHLKLLPPPEGFPRVLRSSKANRRGESHLELAANDHARLHCKPPYVLATDDHRALLVEGVEFEAQRYRVVTDEMLFNDDDQPEVQG